ncbi:MAG: hypothetical protein ACXWPM_05815, partial [Bdellovibrionota bacterium]
MSRLRLTAKLVSVAAVASALASCGGYQYATPTPTGTAGPLAGGTNTGIQFAGGNLTYTVTMAGTLNTTSPTPTPTPCSTSKVST